LILAHSIRANEPTFNSDGSLATNSGNTANPLNGFVQCGGKGGTFNLVPGSNFPSVSIGSSSNAGCLKGHLFNPAPRIGSAWDPKGNGKMAIRGGYGIFYEHTNATKATPNRWKLRPTRACGDPVHVIGYQNIGAGGGSIPFFPLSVVSIPNKAVWPYVSSGNLNIQKELPSHIVLSAAYVGSKGNAFNLAEQRQPTSPVILVGESLQPGEPITGVITDSSGKVTYAGDCATATT